MLRDPAVATPVWGGGAVSVLLLVAGLAFQSGQAVAAPAVQTFGPGQVNCQALTGTRVDCLLTASRVTRDNRNVATFSVTALPPNEQAPFSKWCLTTADECTVTVTGRRDSPQATRLSTVTSVRWTRLSAPVDQAAARAGEAATDTSGGASRPPP